MAINREKVSASAIKLLQAGKYEKAASEFARLVEDDPKDVRSLLKLGDCDVKLGRKADAVAAYQRVAAVYSEQGFYLKAVAVFKQMLRVDAHLPDVHLQLAEMYQQLGLLSDCLQHFQQVAVHYEREGTTDKTLEILKRMVDLDPDNLPSRIKLAELFAQQGRNGEAVDEFNRAAAYLKEHDRIDDFVRVAERLVYFDPSAIAVTRDLAEVYLARGEHKLALGKLQICFKADPRNLGTLTLIAEAFKGMDQLPKTISVYKEMARIYEGQDDAAQARAAWQKALDLSPADAEACAALGIASSAAPAPAAAPAAPPASAAPPPTPDVDPIAEQVARLLTETDVYVKYGLKEKALEHLQKVFALVPEHLDAHDRLRDLHQQMGNRAGLVAQLRTLVDLGQSVSDPRTNGWQSDLDALHQSPEPDSSDTMALDDAAGGILIDPGVPDEPLHDSGPPDLPPDESGHHAVSPDAGLPADAPLDDDPFAYASALNDADAILMEPELDAAHEVLEAYTLDEDAVLPGGPPPPPSAESDEALLLSDSQFEDVVSQESPLDTLAPLDVAAADAAGQVGDTFAPAPATGVEYADDSLDDELAAAASAAVEALSAGDMNDMFGDAFGGMGDLSGAGENAGPTAPTPALLDGAAADGFADAFNAADAGRELPAGFDAPDLPVGSQMPESYGATEIMSLSPTDIQEMRAFAAGDAPRPPPPEQEAGFGDTTATSLQSSIPNELSSVTSAAPLSLEDEQEADAILAAEAEAFEDAVSIGASDAFHSDIDDPAYEIPQDMESLDPEDAAAGFDFDDDDLADLGDLGDDDLEDQVAPFAGMSADDLESALDEAAQDVSDELSAEGSAVYDDSAAAHEEPERPAYETDDAPVALADDAPIEDTMQRGRRLGVADAAHGFENDPAAAFFPDELDEAEFFIKQGIIDEAVEILEEIAESLPEPSPRVEHMKARIAAIEAGEPEPPAPWEQGIIDSVQEELKDLDLEAWGGEVSGVMEQVSVDEVLSQFKAGIKNAVDENDAETHYNLGIAYREMGLLEDAIGEFEIAARLPAMSADAHHLIGLTRLDQADYEGALKSLDTALSHDGQADAQRAAHEYERGRAFEGMGQTAPALMAYEAARTLGSENAELSNAIARVQARVGGLNDAANESPRKKNIDYL